MIVFTPSTSGIEAFQEVVPTAVPDPPVEFVQVTDETDTASEAVPLRRIVEFLVMNDPAGVGPVIAIAGAVVSWITVSTAELLFPEASDAVTVMIWDPRARPTEATDQVDVRVSRTAVPDDGATAPVVDHCTKVTPTLSDIPPDSGSVAFFVTKVGATVGALIEIVGGLTSRVTVMVVDVEFPTTVVAVTVITLTPTSRGTEASQLGDAYVAAPLPAVPALDQVTEATPLPPGSDAFPDRTIGDTLVKKVARDVGPVIETAG